MCALIQEAQRGKRLKVADIEANRMPGSLLDPVSSEMHTEGLKKLKKRGEREVEPQSPIGLPKNNWCTNISVFIKLSRLKPQEHNVLS